jgi:hypothetical protein
MTFDAESECEECEEDSFADDGTFFTVNIYIFSFRALLALLLPRVLSLSFGRLERESQVLCARVCMYEMMCDVYTITKWTREDENHATAARVLTSISLLHIYYIYNIYMY